MRRGGELRQNKLNRYFAWTIILTSVIPSHYISYWSILINVFHTVRRGCIRLQGAVLGIDDEEDSNFTITVDAKVRHNLFES